MQLSFWNACANWYSKQMPNRMRIHTHRHPLIHTLNGPGCINQRPFRNPLSNSAAARQLVKNAIANDVGGHFVKLCALLIASVCISVFYLYIYDQMPLGMDSPSNTSQMTRIQLPTNESEIYKQTGPQARSGRVVGGAAAAVAVECKQLQSHWALLYLSP